MTESPRERPIVASAVQPNLVGALHFEHLVQINDPADPRVMPLRRNQLWRGLVMRAEFPASFVPWLDDCSIERDGTDLLRTLHFGQQTVRDRVRFDGEDAVDYTVLADDDTASSFRMSMRIEQPSADALFVRFTYEAYSADHRDSGPHVGAVREAYRLADIDTIFRIRQLADSGVLGD
jgi:Domain of unknown function (DUF1857)